MGKYIKHTPRKHYNKKVINSVIEQINTGKSLNQLNKELHIPIGTLKNWKYSTKNNSEVKSSKLITISCDSHKEFTYLDYASSDLFDKIKDLSLNHSLGSYLPIKLIFKGEVISTIYVLVGKTRLINDSFPTNLIIYFDSADNKYSYSIREKFLSYNKHHKMWIGPSWHQCNLILYSSGYDYEDFHHCINFYMQDIKPYTYKKDPLELQVELGSITQFEHEYKDTALWAYYQEFAHKVSSDYIKSEVEKEKENGKK